MSGRESEGFANPSRSRSRSCQEKIVTLKGLVRAMAEGQPAFRDHEKPDAGVPERVLPQSSRCWSSPPSPSRPSTSLQTESNQVENCQVELPPSVFHSKEGQQQAVGS